MGEPACPPITVTRALAVVALAACLVPAVNASRVDPMVSLTLIERYRRKLTQRELVELNRLLERLCGDEL
jgi:hypothetical protein